MRHEAILRKPDKMGRPQIVGLKALARRGNATAIAELRGPPRPAALEYLLSWFRELDRVRKHDMNGSPVRHDHVSVESWARMMKRSPAPHEVDALLLLDLVAVYPEAE